MNIKILTLLLLAGVFLTFPPSVNAIYPDTIEEIEAYYLFDDDLTDQSNNAITMSEAEGSASYTAGVLGNALDLDGTNCVESATSGLYFFPSIKIIEFWIHSDGVSANQIPLVMNNADETASLFYYLPSGDSHIIWGGSAGANVHRWTTDHYEHLVIFTNYEGRNIVYNNSQMIFNNSNANTIEDEPAFKVGCNPTNGDNVDGQIDNLIVWNASPTTDNIQAWVDEAYNGGAGRNPLIADVLTNSSWNVTSANVIGNRTEWNAGGVVNVSSDLLSFTFTASANSNASCSLNNNVNYTTMIAIDTDYKLATTDTTEHAYTLADTLILGENTMYCSMIASDGTLELPLSSSGALTINYLDIVLPTFDHALENFSMNNLSVQSWNYNINASDDQGAVYYMVNDTNFTINYDTGVLSMVAPYSVGNYSLNISINDTSDNKQSASMMVNISPAYITYDPLNIASLIPLNESSYTDTNTIPFSFDIDYSASCSLYLNETLNDTIVATVGSNNYPITAFSNGTYVYTWNCTNTTLFESSARRYFNVSFVEPISEPIITLNLSTCPTDTPGFVKFAFGVVFFMFLITLGINYKASMVGGTGALGMFFLSFTITACYSVAGILVIILSLMLLLKFFMDLRAGSY